MKAIFSKLAAAPKRMLVLATLAAALVAPAVVFAYGPERPTYTWPQAAEHVTFNSGLKNPNYGDEREFVTVEDLTTKSGAQHMVKVIPGHEYRVQIYIHNNAASELNASGKGVAIGTKVQAKMPSSIAAYSGADIAGYVYADNAAPKEVFDTARLVADNKVDLEYTGNVHLSTNQLQAGLPNSLVTIGDVKMPLGGGVLVGNRALDGKWDGCLEYAGVITYTFRAKSEVKNIEVCDLTTKQVITIDEKNFDATKHSRNLADCAKKIEVCDLTTGVVTKIDEKAYDAKKHSKNLADCEKIRVCRIADKAIVDIKKSEMSDKYTNDMSKCAKEVPAAPAELPQTGLNNMFGLVGLGSLTAAAAYYINSRRINA